MLGVWILWMLNFPEFQDKTPLSPLILLFSEQQTTVLLQIKTIES